MINVAQITQKSELIIWKSCVVPRLAYCTHDMVKIAGNGVGRTHRGKIEARTPIPPSWGLGQPHGVGPTQGVEVGSLCPGRQCVLQTSEVPRSVWGCLHVHGERLR